MLIQRSRLSTPFKPTSFKEKDWKDRPHTLARQTIGHQVLTADRRAEQIPDAVFDWLDEVLTSVESVVTVGTVSTIDEARSVLTKVERIVTELNFVCSIPYFLVGTFTEGLTKRPLNQLVLNAEENELRRPHIEAHATDMFSHVDCDLGSLLYLCIAELIQIPLCMIEVPQHNFVRWRLSESEHLNWDTNYGFSKFTNDQYARRYGVGTEQMVNGIYLADMSRDNTFGYFSFLRGLTFQGNSQFSEAVVEYRNAVTLYPKSPSPRNNIAWLYASNRTAQSYITAEEAIRVGEEARALVANDANVWDTLACAYAESGDFQTAIRMETEAYRLLPRPEFQEMIDAFRRGETWLDVHG